MPLRRRALRDHQDPRPIVGTAKAAIREAEEARNAAREGLLRHLERDALDRIISKDGPTPLAQKL
jgi:hypothetical protein